MVIKYFTLLIQNDEKRDELVNTKQKSTKWQASRGRVDKGMDFGFCVVVSSV